MGHAWPAGSGGQNTNYVDSTRVNYPAFVMDFWFKNNLRASTVPGPVMTSCGTTVVSGSGVTISGAATASGAVASYAVQLNGPTAINDAAAGNGASFSKGYSVASGYYTGSVSATDPLGQVSTGCPLAQFLVGSAPVLPPPTGLSAGAPTASAVALAWNAVNGATGYNVYRNGAKLTASPLGATSYTAGGLAASTSYSFAVSAVGTAGESALSTAINVTTASAWSCTATSASNYAHVHAGRAHDSGGYALANGSNQNMGLDNLFFTTVLAQTAAGYYVIGACP